MNLFCNINCKAEYIVLESAKWLHPAWCTCPISHCSSTLCLAGCLSGSSAIIIHSCTNQVPYAEWIQPRETIFSIWSIITCQTGIGLNHAYTECQMSRSRHIWLELHQFHLTWMRIAEPHHMMIIMVHWVQNPSFRPTEGKACFISVFENMHQYPHDFFIISVFFQPLTSMV